MGVLPIAAHEVTQMLLGKLALVSGEVLPDKFVLSLTGLTRTIQNHSTRYPPNAFLSYSGPLTDGGLSLASDLDHATPVLVRSFVSWSRAEPVGS